MDLENEGRTERGREERGRVSSMRITFHLVENLFLDGNERERCSAGLISPSFRRVGLVARFRRDKANFVDSTPFRLSVSRS